MAGHLFCHHMSAGRLLRQQATGPMQGRCIVIGFDGAAIGCDTYLPFGWNQEVTTPL